MNAKNIEIGLTLHSPESTDIDLQAFRLELHIDEEAYKEILWHGYEDGKPVTFDTDPYTSFWRRFGVGFMSLFPIESQL